MLDRKRKNEKRIAAAKRALKKYDLPFRLHLGCGKVHFDGWLNIDLDDGDAVDIKLDMTWPLPFEDDSCEYIFTEHMLEHLSVEQGLLFLKECRRVLKKGGVLRVAMPSLDRLVQSSHDGSWRDADWLSWPEYRHVRTRAEMLNMAFREWGHRWLYDREELYRRLGEAGYQTVSDCAWGVSKHADLCGLETRKDSLLIAEAEK
jgi:predicted SAM-dependent methyltransferase